MGVTGLIALVEWVVLVELIVLEIFELLDVPVAFTAFNKPEKVDEVLVLDEFALTELWRELEVLNEEDATFLFRRSNFALATTSAAKVHCGANACWEFL